MITVKEPLTPAMRYFSALGTRLWNGLDLPRLKYAIVCAVLPTYLAFETLSPVVLTAVAVALAVIAVFSLIWYSYSFVGISAIDVRGPTEELLNAVDEYCEQVLSRRVQRPWVLASLVAYVSAFCLFVHDDDGALVWKTLSVAYMAIVCMLYAGTFAEDNPPVQGAEAIVAVLRSYEPENREKYVLLMLKIRHGLWQMEDLIKFAASEDQLVRTKRRALAHGAGQVRENSV